MNWLVSLVVGSVALSVIATKIYEVIAGNIIGPTAQAVKTSIFVSAWTAFTTVTGLRAVTEFLRHFRRSNKEFGERAAILSQEKRIK